jgi:amino acid adenylation domain-containing protein
MNEHDETASVLPLGGSCSPHTDCGTTRHSLRLSRPGRTDASPATLLAAVLLLGRKYADTRAFTVGLLRAGRSVQDGAERFTSPMPGGLTAAELVRSVDRALAELPGAPAAHSSERHPSLLCVLDGPVAPGHGFDLTVSVETDDLGTSLHVDRHQHVQDAAFAERMLRHLEVLLETLTTRPQATLGAISLLTEAEEAALLQVNDTARPYPRESGVYELFQAEAASRPERTAIRHQDGELSYGELADRAERLARVLHARGVRGGDRVALLLAKTPLLPAAMLAVLRLGAAYVPIDAHLPENRRAVVLADSGAGLLLTDDTAVRADVAIVRMDASAPIPDEHTDLPPLPVGAAKDIAYVMYTSGTTGVPKGVQIDQRGIVRLVRGTDYVRLDADTRMLQTGSIAFDAATFEFWGALLNGGSLALVPEHTVLDAGRFGAAIAHHRINTMFLTTALFNQLVEQDAAVFGGGHVLVGGEAASPRHFAKALAASPDAVFSNVYGPTENTTFSTIHTVVARPDGPVPIGRPIANSTGYVLDEEGNPQPIGVPGELHVGGDGLSVGYLGRPELDEGAFSHRGPGGERLYRTGDIARWTPEMTLEYVGRRDHQVKIRGFRIELAEVEAHLGRVPGVGEAVALVRQAAGGPAVLCGYYTAERPLGARELRTALLAELPDYMVPTRFLRLERMPLTRNQKVDRAALGALEPVDLDAGAQRREPATARERTAVELFAEVLGVPAVGLDDDFFSLGGHSLLAMRLWSRVRTELDPRIGLSELLARPSAGAVALLAERADAPGAGQGRLARPKLTRRG